MDKGLVPRLVCLALACVMLAGGGARRPTAATPASGAWLDRPLLSYFALTASLAEPLRQGAELSAGEFAAVQAIAGDEQRALRTLFDESRPIVESPSLSLAEKRLAIQALGYNRRVEAIVYASDRALRGRLSHSAYSHLVTWIEGRWPYEVQQHGLASFPALAAEDGRWAKAFAASFLPASPGVRAGAPRTYRIYATHYEAKKGASVAALPDQCLKLANGGLHTCDDKGYTAGASYTIVLRYKESAGVVVGESGPWNIDDNFWATSGDPAPRRLFADLPAGMPEAQAAFYNGYNGGVDQFGRTVTAPFAIDLSRPVGDAIGLPWGQNDWVTVSFLWTAEWGDVAAPAGGAAAAVQPVTLASPAADGSIRHAVQSGETLWAIAVSYGVTLAELRTLNGLGESTVILPGQVLHVKPAGPTWTPDATRLAQSTPSPGVSATPLLTELPLPARRTEKAIRQAARAATQQAAGQTAGPATAANLATPATLAPATQHLPPPPTAALSGGIRLPATLYGMNTGIALLLFSAVTGLLAFGVLLAWLARRR
jgi:hypothetical protein